MQGVVPAKAGTHVLRAISCHSWLHLRQRTDEAEISLKRA